MSQERILIVEDDEDIQQLVRLVLTREGYQVTSAVTGEEGLAFALKGNADLVLLDLMLPGINGLDVARKLRTNPTSQNLPIIMLTAKGEEIDIVTGLELGADDYITKPFSNKVLIARIRSVLRRRSQPPVSPDSIISKDGLVIHPGKREVTIGNVPVDLTYSEFSILHLLAGRPGWVFTRYQIVDAVHGDEHPVSDRSVDVQIVSLRKKLGRVGMSIETVRGVGYRFKEI